MLFRSQARGSAAKGEEDRERERAWARVCSEAGERQGSWGAAYGAQRALGRRGPRAATHTALPATVFSL